MSRVAGRARRSEGPVINSETLECSVWLPAACLLLGWLLRVADQPHDGSCRAIGGVWCWLPWLFSGRTCVAPWVEWLVGSGLDPPSGPSVYGLASDARAASLNATDAATRRGDGELRMASFAPTNRPHHPCHFCCAHERVGVVVQQWRAHLV